ncbi:hypothetical protein GCM10027605_57720 [Micromonospora zhanjiangensis]
MHRFVDPADGETYLYAMSFLDDVQRVFAAFDQPDLKAPVSLSVTAPADWTVAANGHLVNGPGSAGGPGRWEFAPTAPLATYLVALIAGPYHVRRDEHDGIPLAIWCRRSLAGYLDADAEEIFDVTRRCLDRFHELFGERYPFGKYDQAFVPEFNLGAMENPGLVAIRDDYVFRSVVTESQREQRATTIAHEMAHMWFGNLVTMRWWDDLWLNESFAEYLGFRVAAEATRYDRAWTTFAMRRKAWGTPPTSARRPIRWHRPRSPTRPRRCSTSTASRTPRAPPCCVNWSPGSATTRSWPACGRTSRRTGSATPRWPTCSTRSPAAAGTWPAGPRCGCAGPRSTRCGPR